MSLTQIQNIPITQVLKSIDTYKIQLDSLRPIKPEYNQKISQKFQLEFNYHSNHIEGNTLTIGETKMMIVKGVEASVPRKIKDVLEMKGHLEAYDYLGFLTERVLTADRLPLELNQSFIKNLHKIVLVENEIIKKTVDGITTTTTIPAGDYKKHNNHVETKNGIFEYADLTQVPQLMSDLLDWYNRGREQVHPLVLASMFHYKFIRIHPFGDGNGRMARLLMNLILQSSGLVLALIKSDKENKDKYLNSLSLTDNNFLDITDCIQSNNPDLFEPFVLEIGECLKNSFDIVIRGAKGEDITDIDDIIKLAENRERQKNQANLYSYNEVISNLELLKQAENQMEQINKYLNSYIDKVLKQMFFYTELNLYNEIEGDCEFVKNINIQTLRVDEIYEIYQYNLILKEPKSNHSYSETDFDLIFKFNFGRYELSSKKFNLKESFYYIDPNFDTKLKQLIKNIDEWFPRNTLSDFNITNVQMPF